MAKLATLVRRIDLSDGGCQAGFTGMLFGNAQAGLVVVGAFRPCTIYDFRTGQLLPDLQLDRAFERAHAASTSDPELQSYPELIGWCSIRAGGRTGLSENETEFHNGRFQGQHPVALVVRPAHSAHLEFEVYTGSGDDKLWSGRPVAVDLGTPSAEAIDIEVAAGLNGFQSSSPSLQSKDAEGRLEQNEKPSTRPPAAVTPSTTKGAPEPVFRRLAPDSVGPAGSPSKRGIFRWVKVAAVALIFAVGICVGIYARRGAVALQVTDRSKPNTSAGQGLGIRVQSTADGLLVKWNQGNPALQSATYGVLFVDDGATHRDVILAASQVKNGSVLYKPASDQVSLRIEIFGKTGSLGSDSLLVLGNSGRSSGSAFGAASVMPESKTARGLPDASPRAATVPAYVPPRPLNKVLPDASAQRLPAIRMLTDVEVTVRIDEQGRVISAQLAGNVPKSDELLAQEAIAAAERWTFAPARMNGKPVSAEHSIIFEFQPFRQ